jgi:hypothetical protein
MMGGFRFSIYYFVISSIGCALVGAAIYFRSLQYGNFGFDQQTTLAVVLTLLIPAGLMSISFRMLNGGAGLRPVSAIVLTFFLSIIGIAASLVIGLVFKLAVGFLFESLTIFLRDGALLAQKYIAIARRYFFLLSMYSGLNPFYQAVIFAVLGSLFGLPLARIATGSRFADAWSRQAGKRWPLFWKSGVGVFGLSIVWMAVYSIAYLVLLEPIFVDFPFPNNEADIAQTLFRQPSLFNISFRLGMNLFLISLALGVVAYTSEKVRRTFD